jgi:propionyl-CoA synthetase
MPPHTQITTTAHSLVDPESFWSYHAAKLHWHRKPSRALTRHTKTLPSGVSHEHWSWFADGEISTSYNCVDRHVLAGHGDNVAIIWESPVTGSTETYTYAQLLDEIEVLAGVLREEGVKKGDVVIIYSMHLPITPYDGSHITTHTYPYPYPYPHPHPRHRHKHPTVTPQYKPHDNNTEMNKLTNHPGVVPMIPAALIAALAITRLGAIHAAVFGGFAPQSLAQRIEAARPRAIMTASCGIEGNKGPIAYRPLVEGAINASRFKPSKVFVWQRDQLRWNRPDKRGGQRNWQRLVKSARGRGIRAKSVPVMGTEGVYVIYTSGEYCTRGQWTVYLSFLFHFGISTLDNQPHINTHTGTTGLPKGVLREAGGHAVGLTLSTSTLFNIKGPGDVMFCASDIGWVVGHSYILYGPLLVGATTILYEGKPVGTPDAGIFWRLIEKHKANVLFTAPTAIRAMCKDDPENVLISEVGRRGGLKSLRGLFLAGERSEPSIVRLYQGLLERFGAVGATVVDNWWSSESGSPITGLMQNCRAAIAGSGPGADVEGQSEKPLALRPGSAGLPLPGFDVRIVDDEGIEVSHGTMGNIVLGLPLGPTAFTNLFMEDERFYRGYLKRFQGRWVDTGDSGMVDGDGYLHVMSRSDDIINVAAHRLGTGMFSLSLTHSLSFYISRFEIKD